jgi:hypothetical protein
MHNYSFHIFLSHWSICLLGRYLISLLGVRAFIGNYGSLGSRIYGMEDRALDIMADPFGEEHIDDFNDHFLCISARLGLGIFLDT